MTTPDKLQGDEILLGDVADFLEMQLESTDWIIDPFLPAGGRMLLYGETGEGKSQLAMTAAFAVLQGHKFLQEYQCSKGPVVYIQADMPMQEWYERLEINTRALTSMKGLKHVFYPAGLDIIAEAKNSHSQLAEFIREATPKLVVVDVLSETHRLDENDNGVPGPVYRAWHAVVGPGAGILFVHHEKKPQGDFRHNKYAFSGAHKWLDLSSSSWRVFPKKNKTEIWLENPKAARNAPRMDQMRLERTPELLMVKSVGEAVDAWLAKEIEYRRHPKEFLAREAQSLTRWAPGKALSRATVYRRLEHYSPVSEGETVSRA